LMARPGITAPIASASKPEQVGDLVKATTLKLSSGWCHVRTGEQ
jgi:aryl-alcohol dehydrogenase-like predicted oxidoreductase